jgi:alginate O-acetyltransferase complex protein AlgI
VLFNSAPFLLGLLPLTLAGFFLVGRLGGTVWALRWIIAASLVFYGWSDPRFVVLLAGSIVTNYLLGQQILILARAGRARGARSWLVLGVTLNLGLLGWFKYAGFLVRLGATVGGWRDPALDIALPLAISFFTFQQIMFLADSARGDRPDAGFTHYAAFVAFFPHLIAGPIVRPRDIIPQLLAGDLARPRAEAIAEGLEIFLLGLAKKVVLADTFAHFADVGFDAAARGVPLTLFEAWYALLAYGLQIYFDFSGYSDMAIGLARMLNIRFPLNFDSPYRARDIGDFWRRWHITLGQFLRDYLYIPLGGSRVGKARRIANLMVTMLLCGLWHGAALRFVLWGGLHGAFLAINVAWRRRGVRLPGLLAHLLTLACVVLAWVPFRAQGVAAGLTMLRGLFGANGIALPQMMVHALPWLGMIAAPVASLPSLGDARTLSFPEVSACLVLGWAIVLCAPQVHALSQRARSMALTAGFALSVQAVFFAPSVTPFLYFRF